MTTSTPSSGLPQRTNRQNGVVYTPPKIAAAITAKAVEMGYADGAVLEPSVGDGAFLDALMACGVKAQAITAADVDPEVLRELQTRAPAARYHRGDFIEFALSEVETKHRLVIGNPPYIRRANFHPKFAAALDRLSEASSYPRSLLKNAWAAFVAAAELVLAPDGMLVFVVPYELLNVDYGVAIQRFLAEKFGRVDVVVSERKAFQSLDQDAVVFFAQRSSPTEGVFIHRVNDFEHLNLEEGRRVEYDDDIQVSLSLKSFLIDLDLTEWLSTIRTSAKTVGDYFSSHTGTVTAANEYFILRKTDVERLGLSEWARPILKKGSYLSDGPIFNLEDFERMAEHYPAYVLDFRSVDGVPSEFVQSYLNQGVSRGIDQSYKARHRAVWYHVPIAKTSSAFFFKRSHSYPRIILNQADCLVTDTAYVITPISEQTVEGLCFSFYNSITLLFSEIEGRFYGGGVLELTPKEFRRLPLFYSEPSAEEFRRFSDRSRWADPKSLALHGDEFLVRQHGFSKEELNRVHNAWIALRNHRLRHGTRSIEGG